MQQQQQQQQQQMHLRHKGPLRQKYFWLKDFCITKKIILIITELANQLYTIPT